MQLVNPEVRIETTNFCNANCVVCAQRQMTRQRGNMELSFFKHLVEQAKQMGATTISPFGFGEPLIDEQLTDKIKICEDLGLKTFITTNGSLCTWLKMFDLFSAGLRHIRFSIHGINEGDYEKTQKGLKFDTVMTNLFSTLLLRDKVQPDCEISVTSMPMNDTEMEHSEMWNFAGVDYVELWKPHNWSSVKDYREKTKKRKKSCNRPFRGPLQIQWDGKVIPCCFLTNAELVLGDAHEQTLEEILKGEAYSEFRRKHEKGDLEGLPCENCDQLNIEHESPLLYSSRDPEKNIETTSSIKFNLEE